MSMSQKVALAEQMAEFQAQLFNYGCPGHECRGIGTLRTRTLSDGREVTQVPGRIVSDTFFWGDHLNYDIPRRPFSSSYDWLSTLLKIITLRETLTLAEDDDKKNKKEARIRLQLARRLSDLLPKSSRPFKTHPSGPLFGTATSYLRTLWSIMAGRSQE